MLIVYYGIYKTLCDNKINVQEINVNLTNDLCQFGVKLKCKLFPIQYSHQAIQPSVALCV